MEIDCQCELETLFRKEIRNSIFLAVVFFQMEQQIKFLSRTAKDL